MTDRRPGPRKVLVVGWFPSAENPTSGRFIADQVEALRASGAVLPSMVAFENAAVRGSGPLRDRQARAVRANVATALRGGAGFSPRGAGGPDRVPVARLAVAAGQTPDSGPDHRAIHRTAALLPLVERTASDGWQLVHGHVGYPDGVAAAAAARRLDVPLLLTEHASFLGSLLAEPAVRRRYREAALAADRFIAVSRMLATEVAVIVPELEGRIVVIPNAVAVDEFTIPGQGESVPGELLWVGQRTEAKGTARLLRAFAIVRARRPEATLRLIGRSDRPAEETGWRRLAATLGIADSVRFEPPADRSGVAAAMRRAEVFVHPSTRETFGVVAVEALAAGLPVVATDSGGVTEILGDRPDELGALVRDPSPAALAAAILGVLDRRASFDPERLRDQAASRFGASGVAARIVALYDEVLAERGRDGGAAIGGAERTRRAMAAADRPGDPQPVPTRRVVVVCFSRPELDRAMARLPAGALADAALVTSGGDVAGRPDARLAPAPADRRLAELLGWGGRSDGTLARVTRRLRRATRGIASRIGRPGPDDEPLLAELAATLAAALPATPGPDAPSPDAPLLVCVGGIDHLVAAELVAAGRALPAPGGLRWLADVRAARGAAERAFGSDARAVADLERLVEGDEPG